MAKIGIDCEMVQDHSNRSMLARVSLVDENGTKIYDEHVKPRREVADYRTFITGIGPHHLRNGKDFYQVQNDVKNKLQGRILVGHSVDVDLEALELTHPSSNIRDLALMERFRRNGQKRALKDLAAEHGISIQNGTHDSYEDARAAMLIYNRYY